MTAPTSPQEAYQLLLQKNEEYVNGSSNSALLTAEKRKDLADNGQHPYAIIVTCADSRVPAEHIFNAGLGELFVIRNAGNVVSDFVLGSVEYGVEHLGCKLVVVLGHTNCGAVGATLAGKPEEGVINSIIREIRTNIGDETGADEAENLNAQVSAQKIAANEIVKEFIEAGKVAVVAAKYNIETGAVTFL